MRLKLYLLQKLKYELLVLLVFSMSFLQRRYVGLALYGHGLALSCQMLGTTCEFIVDRVRSPCHRVFIMLSQTLGPFFVPQDLSRPVIPIIHGQRHVRASFFHYPY